MPSLYQWVLSEHSACNGSCIAHFGNMVATIYLYRPEPDSLLKDGFRGMVVKRHCSNPMWLAVELNLLGVILVFCSCVHMCTGFFGNQRLISRSSSMYLQLSVYKNDSFLSVPKWGHMWRSEVHVQALALSPQHESPGLSSVSAHRTILLAHSPYVLRWSHQIWSSLRLEHQGASYLCILVLESMRIDSTVLKYRQNCAWHAFESNLWNQVVRLVQHFTPSPHAYVSLSRPEVSPGLGESFSQ